ncbi:MAG: phage holin family protein [Thermoleophilaceae bacterium]|nr:phage holin family protein [Thermoleophilaceae bacterium]
MPANVVIETRRPAPLPVRIASRWIINVMGLWFADLLGLVSYGDKFSTLALAALVLAGVNYLAKPIVMILSIPLIVLTLGFFVLVVNATMLWITSAIVSGFDVLGFWRTIGAAIVMSLANLALSGALHDLTDTRKRESFTVVD